MRIIVYMIAFVSILTGCKAGRDFRAPIVEMPNKYVGVNNQSTAELLWWNIFSDTTLLRLINTSLSNNRDIAIAFSRVEQARLQMRATRASLYPMLGYSLKGGYGTETPLGKANSPVQSYDAGLNIGWELDLWGKVRRATEAARADIFASEAARKGMLISLVSEVASSYFSLLEYENALEISERTYATRNKSLKLIEMSYARGAVSALDLRQAQQLAAEAAASIPQYYRAVLQTNHALSLLMGQNPEVVVYDHTPLLYQSIPDDIPVGLPSELLERRPDIMQAYFSVVAQNAQVGVAQAMRYPTITLTGAGGLISDDVTNLFMAKSFMWSSAASITGAIFQFGKNKRRVDIARQQLYQSLMTYEQSVLSALREVDDALVDVHTYKLQMQEYQKLLLASKDAQLLSNERYIRGFSSYLDVLDADRSLFQSELSYSQIVQQRLNSYVTLYKSLGGGWVLKD